MAYKQFCTDFDISEIAGAGVVETFLEVAFISIGVVSRSKLRQCCSISLHLHSASLAAEAHAFLLPTTVKKGPLFPPPKKEDRPQFAES